MSDEGWHGLCLAEARGARLENFAPAHLLDLGHSQIALAILALALRLLGGFGFHSSVLRGDVSLAHLVAMTFQFKHLFA